MFHTQTRKFRKRAKKRNRKKIDLDDLTKRLEILLSNYKSYSFCFNIRSLVLSLPKKSMVALWSIFNNWVTAHVHDVPDRIVVLVKDLIALGKKPHI